jgi:hypothetical protein
MYLGQLTSLPAGQTRIMFASLPFHGALTHRGGKHYLHGEKKASGAARRMPGRFVIQSGGSIAHDSSVEPGNSCAVVRSSDTHRVNISPTAMS